MTRRFTATRFRRRQRAVDARRRRPREAFSRRVDFKKRPNRSRQGSWIANELLFRPSSFGKSQTSIPREIETIVTFVWRGTNITSVNLEFWGRFFATLGSRRLASPALGASRRFMRFGVAPYAYGDWRRIATNGSGYVSLARKREPPVRLRTSTSTPFAKRRQFLNHIIKHRRQQDPEQRHPDHSCEDGDAKRKAHFVPRAFAVHERRDA